MKRSLIVGNWKMYATSVADAHILATTIRNSVGNLRDAEVILCPPSIWLTEIAQITKKGKTTVGAQNMFYEPEGAYTGELSPLMIKEVADFVLVGHSERREHFGETDMEVNEKVIAALRAGLSPIICVGEKRKGANATQPVSELKQALMHVPKSHYKNIVVAYEPIWAISSPTKAENADPEYVAKVITKLRELVSADTPILYGGSVNSKNVKGYAERPELDGVLVGGASVRAADFIKVCKTWYDTKRMN